jgi:hypothetical protein
MSVDSNKSSSNKIGRTSHGIGEKPIREDAMSFSIRTGAAPCQTAPANDKACTLRLDISDFGGWT